MNNIKKRITLLNTFSTLILQIATIFSGFIIPKIILDSFGSNVNGLVSSLTKFLSYITLVDGGLAGVVTASLYKPITEKNHKKISAIVRTTKNFYYKISLIFILYTLIVAILYPLIFNTGFSFLYVFSLTLILSISMMVQYIYSLTIKSLLNADKKIYIVSFTQTVILILGIILAFISVKVYPNIHLLKFLTGALFILQPIVYSRACKKYYKLEKDAKEDKSLIKSRWDGFAINLAAFIHGSTDIVVLTIFKDLASVSVYSVYAIVVSGIRNIISSLTSSLNPTLGQAYARKDTAGLNKKLDMYEYLIFMLVTSIFTVAGLLIVPFVMIYTHGINDANYYEPLFAILLLISEAIYLLKFPHLTLAYSANKFKEISPSGFIEAGVNIALSVILVPFLGLVGVAIGTIISMTYRLIYHVNFTKKLVKNRKQSIFYSKLMIFTISAIISIAICLLLVPTAEYTILSWVWHAVIYLIIVGIVLIITSLIFYKEQLDSLLKYIRKR